MEESITCAIVLLGLTTGLCMGFVAMLLYNKTETSTGLQGDIQNFRKEFNRFRQFHELQLMNLRTDFNQFRDTHDRELMSIIRETLHTTTEDEPSVS